MLSKSAQAILDDISILDSQIEEIENRKSELKKDLSNSFSLNELDGFIFNSTKAFIEITKSYDTQNEGFLAKTFLGQITNQGHEVYGPVWTTVKEVNGKMLSVPDNSVPVNACIKLFEEPEFKPSAHFYRDKNGSQFSIEKNREEKYAIDLKYFDYKNTVELKHYKMRLTDADIYSKNPELIATNIKKWIFGFKETKNTFYIYEITSYSKRNTVFNEHGCFIEFRGGWI